MLGRYMLRELLLQPELVATGTKVSRLPESSTPSVHSPIIAVHREPEVVFVEMPKGVFPVLKLRPRVKGAE